MEATQFRSASRRAQLQRSGMRLLQQQRPSSLVPSGNFRPLLQTPCISEKIRTQWDETDMFHLIASLTIKSKHESQSFENNNSIC